MNFGALSGFINGTESVVFDYEVAGSATTSIDTGNILNGNEDGWYTVIIYLNSNSSGVSPTFRFNGDTANNYGYRGTSGINTTIADVANSSSQQSILNGIANAGEISLVIGRVYAKSGTVRLTNWFSIGHVTTTLVTDLYSGTSVWSNTADNIVSMQYTASGAYLGVGTRMIVLKQNAFTNGTPTGAITTPYIKGSWVRVGSSVLGLGGVNQVNFTGLDGDRDVLYAYSACIKAEGDTDDIRLRFNNDTGATNYASQVINGYGTGSGAARAARAYHQVGYATAANRMTSCSGIIWAKSGFQRPALAIANYNLDGTTFLGFAMCGWLWLNSADNITAVGTSSFTADDFAEGTQIELYALRPNG